MKEPPQYESGTDGGLRLTKEWKAWRVQHMSQGFQTHNATKTKVSKRKNIGRRMPIDPTSHAFLWKEIAWLGDGKRILFCCCQSGTGLPYAGCGAVAIRHSRAGKLTVVVESRFE